MSCKCECHRCSCERTKSCSWGKHIFWGI